MPKVLFECNPVDTEASFGVNYEVTPVSARNSHLPLHLGKVNVVVFKFHLLFAFVGCFEYGTEIFLRACLTGSDVST